ncbi:MAG: endo-1,4-beta-xylanase [Oscillospiraceae bacterium]|jgi:endo-1,4-beta-xylanase|nr:endo-1,4-beta-xylanase [Oscillospiraceae bacterium]
MKRRLLTLTVIMVMLLTLVPIFAMVSAEAEKITEVFIDFEDGSMRGIGAFAGASASISTEQAFSGETSLLVKTGNNGSAGIRLNVTQYITPNKWYEVSFWAFMKTTDYAFFGLHTELKVIGSGNEWNDVLPVTSGSLTQEDGWVQFKQYFYYDSSKHNLNDVKIIIETNQDGSEYYIDDFTFRLSDINQNIIDSRRLPSLYQMYENYFMLGTAHNIDPFNVDSPDPNFLPLLRHHFNAFTSGAHSWSTTPEKGVFDFSISDKNIDILYDADFILHGHVLVYRLDHAKWLTNNEDGSYLTRAEAIENMEWYVNGVAGRYKEKFYSWEAVNEVIGNFPGGVYYYTNEPYSGSPWYMAFSNGADKSAGEGGWDYIEYAFRFARAADPSAKLIYNETGEELPQMADFMADMVKRINDKWLAEGNDRLLIEGVGMQSHYSLDTKIEDIERSIKLFIDIGVDVSISELGLRVFDFNDEVTEPTDELFDRQATMYAELFQLYKKYSNHIDRVTIYGFDDATSWLNFVDPNGGYHTRPAFPRYPLLFNGDFTPKLAYFAVIDPEGYLAGNFDTEEKRIVWLAANMLPEPDPTPTPNDDPQTPQDPTSTPTVTPDPNITPPQNDPNVDAKGSNTLWIALGVGGTLAIAVVVVLVIKKKR